MCHPATLDLRNNLHEQSPLWLLKKRSYRKVSLHLPRASHCPCFNIAKHAIYILLSCPGPQTYSHCNLFRICATAVMQILSEGRASLARHNWQDTRNELFLCLGQFCVYASLPDPPPPPPPPPPRVRVWFRD